MTEERKKEIKEKLYAIIDEFNDSEKNREMTMFDLISIYNEKHENPELIGGDWAEKNGFDLP